MQMLACTGKITLYITDAHHDIVTHYDVMQWWCFKYLENYTRDTAGALKMLDVKLTDQFAGHEIAGHETGSETANV